MKWLSSSGMSSRPWSQPPAFEEPLSLKVSLERLRGNVLGSEDADLRDYYLQTLSDSQSYHLVYVDESGCDKRAGLMDIKNGVLSELLKTYTKQAQSKQCAWVTGISGHI